MGRADGGSLMRFLIIRIIFPENILTHFLHAMSTQGITSRMTQYRRGTSTVGYQCRDRGPDPGRRHASTVQHVRGRIFLPQDFRNLQYHSRL
ncbi:unnamed protein product [Toxocara canis]|uniref:Secreted protein n=1 Tax=Toxocara canis TaxID=6265 RepID=A0A183UI50_TOXCA|nr:unnamed protein product [Toxocara canis]